MTVSQGDVLQWSLQDPASGNWWATHALYCRSTSSTVDIWTRANYTNGSWVEGDTFTDGMSYNHSTKTWQDVNTASNHEPHTPTGFTSNGGTTVANTNPAYVRIQINSSTGSHYVWIQSPYFVSGPTVTTSRTTHTGSDTVPEATDFTIRDPNPGVWYEKTGAGKFKLKFYDQNEAFGGYNITIDWTSMDNTSASHTETVSASSGDYNIEIDTLNNGVKHNSNITITFNQNTYYKGVFYTSGTVLKTFTYLANGPFSGSITPNGGDDWSNIQISIQDDNPHPQQLRTVSYEKANGTQINATLSSSNSWQFSTTYSGTMGTVKIYNTDKDNATNNDIIASAYFHSGSAGGRPRDGYPIEITNLFNRNRAIYSIGMTHKTAGDPFL